jgi:hypothetical protein
MGLCSNNRFSEVFSAEETFFQKMAAFLFLKPHPGVEYLFTPSFVR